MRATADLFATPKAGRWWLAARLGEMVRHALRAEVPDRYALRVVISPPEGWRGSLVGLLNPLVDGLIAAMHAHGGPIDPIVDRASTIDPTLTPAELRDLLAEPASAPLGRVRLLVARAAGVMWLPADDHLVALDVRLTGDQLRALFPPRSWRRCPSLDDVAAIAAGYRRDE